jgi:hypothetical protein
MPISIASQMLHHSRLKGLSGLFHKKFIFLWGVGVGQENPPIEWLLTMVQELN